MGTFFEVLLEYLQAICGLIPQAISWGQYIIDLLFNALPLFIDLTFYLYPPLALSGFVVIGIGVVRLICSILTINLEVDN